MRTPDMSRPLDLTGRVILVTGGAGAIGSAVAGQAARLGATVVIADNGTSVTGVGEDPEVVRVVAKQLAQFGIVSGHHCDLTVPDQVEAMFDSLFAEHGNVDGVVAAAGTLRVKPIWETTPDDWRNVLDSHATHTFLVAAAACRRWRDNCAQRAGSPCSLVNFTAATGLVGRPDLGITHSAGKGAVAGMTLELAHEMFPFDVSVNAVVEANVRGRMADHVNAKVSEDTDTFDTSSPEHAGLLAAYLASGDASFITGQVFRVMGGLIGRYSQWEVTSSLDKGGFWTVDDMRLGIRRLTGAYPEYKALQGLHREF
ncbi:MAG TPA: SDR family oxidoreductase [Candidatus Limnocylindrales bacterium]|nr:SDR family oxidoreductase [Candidatus Limnocylindrales bacterium]